VAESLAAAANASAAAWADAPPSTSGGGFLLDVTAFLKAAELEGLSDHELFAQVSALVAPFHCTAMTLTRPRLVFAAAALEPMSTHQPNAQFLQGASREQRLRAFKQAVEASAPRAVQAAGGVCRSEPDATVAEVKSPRSFLSSCEYTCLP
jgi:hypothetical protein